MNPPEQGPANRITDGVGGLPGRQPIWNGFYPVVTGGAWQQPGASWAARARRAGAAGKEQ